MMLVVLDTNVLVSAMLWAGQPRRLLDLVEAGLIRSVTSEEILADLRDVLGRRKFASRLLAAGQDADRLMLGVRRRSTVVEPVRVVGVAPDPDDDVVLGTAQSAGAAYLVTGDVGLLSLGQFHGTAIVGVGEFLAKGQPRP